MPTTASGWPYVEDEAHPIEYPPVTQTMASKLETFDTITSQILTPQNGYVVQGYAVTVVRNGAGAYISGKVRRTSGTSLVMLNAGTIPAAARPPVIVAGPTLGVNGAAIGPQFLVVVDPDGSLSFTCPSGQVPAWTTSTDIAFTASWAV